MQYPGSEVSPESLRDDECRKLVTLLRTRRGPATWGTLNEVIHNPHTLQVHLDHLKADQIVTRDPLKGGRGVRGVYSFKKPREEESQTAGRIDSIVKSWTAKESEFVEAAHGGEATALARSLKRLEETRMRELAALILASQRVCNECDHLSERHEGRKRGFFERCNENVALQGEKFKRCGCKMYKPDETGAAGVRLYLEQVRQIGLFTDDIAFALLTKHREFALPALEIWLGTKLSYDIG